MELIIIIGLYRCPSCGYYGYTGRECYDCGYVGIINKNLSYDTR